MEPEIEKICREIRFVEARLIRESTTGDVNDVKFTLGYLGGLNHALAILQWAEPRTNDAIEAEGSVDKTREGGGATDGQPDWQDFGIWVGESNSRWPGFIVRVRNATQLHALVQILSDAMDGKVVTLRGWRG